MQRNKNHSWKFVLMHTAFYQTELLSPEVTCLKTNRNTLALFIDNFEKKLIFLTLLF